jgi:hypothetical protein
MKQEAAELAGWEDEQLEFIREKVTEEGKREDLKKGKAPQQVATRVSLICHMIAFNYFLADSIAFAALVHCRWFLTRRHS